MSAGSEYFHYSGMSYAELVALNEKIIQDKNSQLYARAKNAFAAKLAEIKETKTSKIAAGKRRRLVVQYVLEPEQIFTLGAAYPQYDLVFKSTERCEGALAKAIVYITVERLFDRLRGSWRAVVAYGMSLNHLILQNRHWVHLCVPQARAEVQAALVRDDRVMCAVLNASAQKGRMLPLRERYARGDLSHMMCSDPVTCKHSGLSGVMYLGATDTTYMQLCAWMNAHGTDLMFFAVPLCKAMEHCFDSEFPELDAYVKCKDGIVSLLFKNAQGMAQDFTHRHYITLIAQVHIKIGQYIYTKEFCDLENGIATYKVTRALQEFTVDPLVYRSWTTPKYKSQYLVTSVEPVSNISDLFDPRSYQKVQFSVDMEPMDKLLEHMMSIEAQDATDQAAMRKLRSLTSVKVIGGYNMVYGGLALDEKRCMHLAFVAYVRCFMTKYVTGVTLKKLTGEDRELQELRKLGIWGLVPHIISYVFFSGFVMPFHKLAGFIRRVYVKFFGSKVHTLPQIDFQPGFTQYDNTLRPVGWFKNTTWAQWTPRPWEGFDPFLTGGPEAAALGRIQQEVGVDRTSHSKADPNIQLEIAESLATPLAVGGLTDVPVERGPLVASEGVVDLAGKVTKDNEGLVDLRVTDLTMPSSSAKSTFVDAHNGHVDDPVVTLSRTLGRLFPGSTLMQTDQVGSELHYGDFEIIARSVLTSIDSSKLRHAKPEYIYKPVIGNQLVPNAKQTLQNTLPTVVKRNLNTTSSTDAMDVDELWDRTWSAMKSVYYVQDVEDRLHAMEYIGPTVETVAVWASKIDELSRQRAMSVNFTRELLDLESNKLMLKSKRKVNMGPSYAQAVKPAQSIQYDSTKSRTGVYSPIFAEKVRRDKSVLLDKVFIMQSKSPEDMNKFLGQFSWLSDARGFLRYLELDAEMFDKSQVLATLAMHWKKCEKFGVLPSYMKVLQDGTTFRTASSVEAGIKVHLTPQRGSGDSDTLDANCDVSQAAYARFFQRIQHRIEFILIMGDDVTVAVRGDVDTQDVEEDCMREFNLSVKLTLSSFGYFVSGWLVHLPDGSIVWRTDPVKRALSVGDRSVAKDTDFTEKHVSLNDLCAGLEGYATQLYIGRAASERLAHTLGVEIDPLDVIETTKAVVTLAASPEKYRSLFAAIATKRYL